jgi:oligopeptidase B
MKFNPDRKPPVIRKETYETEIHGLRLQDPYFWIRNRDNKEVIDLLREENAYADHVMKPTKKFQKKLYDEMLLHLKETDFSVPAKRDHYYYYSRTEEGKQYPIYARKKETLESEEEVILDVNILAEGHDFFNVANLAMSPDHQFLAYLTDVTGDEIYELSIKNLVTNVLLPDRISNVSTSLEWAMDNKNLFYSRLDDLRRPFQVYRHSLGDLQENDGLIFHEKDDGYFVDCYKTKDHKYFVIDSSSKTTSEAHFLNAHDAFSPLKIFNPREEGHEYSLDHHEDHFYIVTNDQAQNFRLAKTLDHQTEKKYWQDVLKHRPEVKIEDIEIFEKYLVVFERVAGINRIRVESFEKGNPYYVDFDEAVYNVWCGNNYEYKTDLLRFGYCSLVTPNSVFDFHLENRIRTLKKRQEVPGGYDPALYTSERVMAQSPDGTQVPISMVYRKSLKKDGQAPCLLYGYGSYGHSLDPNFSSTRLSLLDRGFIYALAHIRGGGDLGRPWYDDGKLDKKQNTFSDFIACAEYLIENKYTQANRLVISGGSAGGMLMGAVLNQRPELFQGAVMHVPFVDVLNTMLDASIPLTVTEYDEWGNPNEKKAFDTILQYSPYNNIKAQRYPHVLVTGGLNDTRVQYWEPTKWVARIREMKVDSNLVILKMNMGAGHGGASGRYDYLKEIALDYAFMCNVVGINE